jgi:hypothetical protein
MADHSPPNGSETPAFAFTLTDVERGTFNALVAFGELLVGRQRAACADQPAALEALEVTDAGILALAFLGGLDPDGLAARTRGTKIGLHVVPYMVPCECVQRRIVTKNGVCKHCNGQRRVLTVVPPEHRLHTWAELEALGRKQAPQGPQILDTRGKPTPS